ncbi:MAG: hypothetical protein GEU98_15355 [Pseudonocardiaceae bacterium]|nr:hypothetical protein [Pseudonocardiaceae bacterium]
MLPAMPAKPMSIELNFRHRRLWWRLDDDDHRPERWEVSADVWYLDHCPAEARHVGDISIVIADLTRERNLLDSAELEWALEFIAETVIDTANGGLHPELDKTISPGQPRMLVLRHIELTPPWRGYGLAGPLLASALLTLGQSARLAACRVSPLEFGSICPDRVSAELASVRMGRMLERIGFQRWRGVHVVDLRQLALRDAGFELLESWQRDADGE